MPVDEKDSASTKSGTIGCFAYQITRIEIALGYDIAWAGVMFVEYSHGSVLEGNGRLMPELEIGARTEGRDQ